MSSESSDPQSSDNDYVKMSSQWSRKLEEAKELNQQLMLSNVELEKEMGELKQQLGSTEQRAKTLEVERDLAVKKQVNREREMKTIAEEHLMEVQELQERISFLERRLESTELGRELQERLNYLEQQLRFQGDGGKTADAAKWRAADKPIGNTKPPREKGTGDRDAETVVGEDRTREEP